MLAGRRIVLGITGGVAAYKAAYLARRLVERGARVETVLTAAAGQFVGAQTLAAITGTEPHTALFGPQPTVFGEPTVSVHTDLARRADLIIVAPATASTLGRLANGISDDLLVATLLAAECPVLLAPAMHTEMWEHPATKRNLASLRADGYHVVGPAEGALAGGDEGLGRLVETEDIVAAAVDLLGDGDLAGWRVLVTAGGTREPIDPVRFLGNRSSGKMGHAIAEEAARRGAEVGLVTTAPEAIASPGRIRIVAVETAAEMRDAVWAEAATADVAVLAAAVADFRPADPEDRKLRRSEGPPEIRLEPTPDILAGVAAMEPRPFLVGFAAETGSLAGAKDKAVSKGVDLLVANDVTRSGSGFGTDTNEVTLIGPDGSLEEWELLPKRDVAARLWDRVRALRSESRDAS